MSRPSMSCSVPVLQARGAALQRPGGEDWFEWEERPGPEPAEDTDRLSDEQIIRVSYVERKGPLGG